MTPGVTGRFYSLSRKEGWRRYVDAPARDHPEQLTVAQLKVLGGDARADYDDGRHDWHANFGILRTPQLAAVHDELTLITATNRQDPDRVRGAAVLDATSAPMVICCFHPAWTSVPIAGPGRRLVRVLPGVTGRCLAKSPRSL